MIRTFWSVRRGISAQDHLTARLAAAETGRPAVRHPAPFRLWIEGGQIREEEDIRVHRHPLLRVLDDPAGVVLDASDDPEAAEFRWAQAGRRAEQERMAQELQEAEAGLHRLAAELMEAQDRLDQAELRRAAQLAQGEIDPPEVEARHRQQRPRQMRRSGLIRLLLAVFALLEAAQFSVPMADLLGVDVHNIFTAPPWLAFSALSFGPISAAALFMLAHTVTGRLRSMEERFTGWHLTWAGGAGGLLCLTSVVLAWLRHALAAGGAGALSEVGIFAVLTLAVAVALALGWQQADRVAGEEAMEAAQRQQVDAGQEQRRQRRERQEALTRIAADRLQAIGAQRSRAQDRLQQLNRQAQEQERALRDGVEAERRAIGLWSRQTRAALLEERWWLQSWQQSGATFVSAAVRSLNLRSS